MFIASNLLLLFAIAVIILSYSYIIGYPFAKKISPNAAFELSFPLGIAILAITVLWINNLLNIGIIQTILIFLLPLGLSFWLNKPTYAFYKEGLLKKSILVLPLLLSFIVASGVCIKVSGSEISLSQPLFDHIKVAVINTIIRDGFPIKNPFTIDPSAGDLFHYYYLFYLLAANIAILFHCSSLNADIILTFIAAFVSILTCFCLLGELLGNSNNRIKAQYILCLFLFSGQTVDLVNKITHEHLFKIFITPSYHPIEGWLVQAAWVPQHLLGASFTVLALFFLGIKNLKEKQIFIIIVIFITVGLGFSVWVGGFTFAIVAFLLFLNHIFSTKTKKSIIIQWVWVTFCSILCALPILYNAISAPTQKAVFPLRFAVYNTSNYSHGFDLIFFFIGAMPLWITAITIGLYLVIIQSVVSKIKINLQCRVLLLICLGALLNTLLIQSRINNNDLGWRAILLFILAGSTIVSYFFVKYFSLFSKILLLFLMISGCVYSILFSKSLFYGNGYYIPKPKMNELEGINKLTYKNDRLLLNIHQNENNEPLGANLLPPLLVDRLFCFENISYVSTFGPNWGDTVFQMDKAIRQFYDGHADENDLALIKQFQCNKIIVTRYDPIWNHIPYHNLKVIYSDNDRKILVFDQ